MRERPISVSIFSQLEPFCYHQFNFLSFRETACGSKSLYYEYGIQKRTFLPLYEHRFVVLPIPTALAKVSNEHKINIDYFAVYHTELSVLLTNQKPVKTSSW